MDIFILGEGHKTIKISKDSISEIRLRGSLYWVSEEVSWELDEINGHGVVDISGPSDVVNSEASKLNVSINDNILRQKLSDESYSTREKIIQNALNKLAQDE